MTDENRESTPQPLEYAKRPSRSRRRVFWSLLLLVVAVAAIVGHRHRREITDWASLARLRHRALTYQSAPGTVVMSQLPADTAQTWGGTSAARYREFDATWVEVEQKLVPPPGVSQVWFSSPVTVFLHERVSPAGSRRVVAGHLSETWFPDGTRINVDVRLFNPGTLRDPRFREITVKETKDQRGNGTIFGFPGTVDDLGTVSWGSDFRLFAGRADPNDPSRFTIDYLHDGVAGSFVGRLNDDDSVSFQSGDGRRLPVELKHIEPAR
jgi:hypothetical protein